MSEKRFMSTVNKFNPQRLTLGETEKRFLDLISLDDSSAYGIFTEMKKSRSMAYKNVHKRVKRLQKLGLIEQVEGDFKQNAIMYRLTSRGLFERLLFAGPINTTVLDRYKDDPILNYILYQYFGAESIRKFDKVVLTQYLKSTCEMILYLLERFQKEGKQDTNLMRNAVRHQIESFVHRIVIMSGAIIWNKGNPKFSSLLPVEQLAKDTKFMVIVKRIKDHFDMGYKRFVDPNWTVDPKWFFDTKTRVPLSPS